MNVISYLENIKNKAMSFALAVSLLGAGCASLPINKGTITELSNILDDETVVVSKKYVPEKYDAGKTVIRSMVFSPLSLLGPPEGYPAEYNITLVGKKTNFKLNDKELYDRFKIDDVVIVNYREVYKCTYEDIDGDGKEDLVKKEIGDYQFLGATLKK